MAIDGMDDWIKKLEKMREDFPKQTETFLRKKANEVIKETKRLTPVDTGTLRNAWQRENNGKFKQVVFNVTSYANHIEWGRRIVRGKKTVGFVKGRYMLHKGISRVKTTFYKDLEIVYKNLIK